MLTISLPCLGSSNGVGTIVGGVVSVLSVIIIIVIAAISIILLYYRGALSIATVHILSH